VEGLVDGTWREVARGTTIGYRRLHAIAPVRVTGLRVLVPGTGARPLPIQVIGYPPA
jgi:hypothetical protein